MTPQSKASRAEAATQAGHAGSQEAASQEDRLLAVVRESLEDHKAEDLVVIDLTGKSSIADFMVIASGRSHRHVSSMADHLIEDLKKAGNRAVSVEGAQRADWVLVDAGDIIIHLFRPEVRSFYNLERMWGEELMDRPQAESRPAGSARQAH